MAERLVTHAFRDSNGVIRAIGNPASDWFQRRREWAISDIVAGRHTYVVRSGQNSRQIRVVDGRSGRYLRTTPDSTADNNLDVLPAFDVRPWEVAHDDAEVLAVHSSWEPFGGNRRQMER